MADVQAKTSILKKHLRKRLFVWFIKDEYMELFPTDQLIDIVCLFVEARCKIPNKMKVEPAFLVARGLRQTNAVFSWLTKH